MSPSHFALPGKIGPVQLFYYASYYSRTQKDSKDGHQLYYINDTHPYFDSSIILLPFLLVKFFSLINLDQIHSLIFWRSVPSFLKLFLWILLSLFDNIFNNPFCLIHHTYWTSYIQSILLFFRISLSTNVIKNYLCMNASFKF